MLQRKSIKSGLFVKSKWIHSLSDGAVSYTHLLDGDDYTTPSVNKQITKKTKVTVNRVTYKEVTKKESVKYLSLIHI